MKIIHLSDLHTGHTDDDADYGGTKSLIERFSKIADNIITKFGSVASEYTILITGDIFDAPPIAYGSVLTIFNKLKNFGFNVLMVPGNHDFLAYDGHNNAIIDLIHDVESRLTMKRTLQNFNQNFYGNKNYIYADKNNLQIINNVCFIGLNSMEGQIKPIGELAARGKLGQAQLNRLKAILNLDAIKDKYKVVFLHHHPFAYSEERIDANLADVDELGAIVNGKIDALLFGHAHLKGIPSTQWPSWNIPRCYDAGSSTHKDGDKALFRIMDLSQPPSSDLIDNFL